MEQQSPTVQTSAAVLRFHSGLRFFESGQNLAAALEL
jgi:hypothetical protein